MLQDIAPPLWQPLHPPEAGAGVNAEFSDDDFREAGAEVLPDAKAVMHQAEVGGTVGGSRAGDAGDESVAGCQALSFGNSFERFIMVDWSLC